jgi:hypothetical protein
MVDILSWEKEYVFRASGGEVTTPYNGSWLGALVKYFGYEELYGASYIQTICYHYGIFEPVNNSWFQALCNYYGFFEPINNSWKYTLAFIEIKPVSEYEWETADFIWEEAEEWN